MLPMKYLVGCRAVGILADVTHPGETTRDARNGVAGEMRADAKGTAVVSATTLGKVRANLFFSVKPQLFPVKIFGNENEAREWLLKLLS